jgi:hypothetical protein
VHDGVPPAASDEPAVDRQRDDARDGQGEGERAPEQDVADSGLHGAGTASMMPLSTISIVAMLSVSAASAIGTTADSAIPARSSGRLVRP